MNTKILAVAAIIIIMIGCSKDDYETRPTLKFKKTTANVIPLNAFFNMTFEITDKEGDIQDSIHIQKISRSCTLLPGFKDEYKIPDFTGTKDLKAEIEVAFVSNQLGTNAIVAGPGPGCNTNTKNDTCYFRFWVKDKGGNVSDTIVSPDIVFLRQ